MKISKEKILACFYCLLALLSQVQAQKQVFEIKEKKQELRAKDFFRLHVPNPKTAETPACHLVFQGIDNQMILQSLDEDLEPVNTQAFRPNPSANFYGFCQSGDYFLFNFMIQNRAHYFILDSKGSKIQSFYTQEAQALRRPALIFPAEQTGFFLVEAPKKTRRLPSWLQVLEYRDTSFQLIWKKDLFFLNRHQEIQQSLVTKNHIFLVANAGLLAPNKIICLDAQTGQIIYQTELPHSKNFPLSVQHILQGPQGEILLVAQLHHRGRNDRGFSLILLDNQGKLKELSHFPWSHFHTQLQGPTAASLRALNPQIWLHSVQPLDNGRLAILAELFSYEKSKELEHNIQLLPFIYMEITPKFELEYLEILNKPRQQIQLIAKENASGAEADFFRDLCCSSRGQALKNQGLFSYQDFQMLPNQGFMLSFLAFESKDGLDEIRDYAYYLYKSKDDLIYYEQDLLSQDFKQLSSSSAEAKFANSTSLLTRFTQARQRSLSFGEFGFRGLVNLNNQYLTYALARLREKNGSMRFLHLHLNLVPKLWP